ncbi:hypothetical protein [Streptomyces sp. NPDC001502]|uniref:hypothetical protein n=1 Tax=Streptomyces sp. NPDC001502 TaxID=3364578 RepID=UPI0036B5287C
MPSTTHWSAYDGRARRPRAEALRAVCACGWGPVPYRLDWDTIGDQSLYEADVDLAGPLADWTVHLSVVREAAVPLPEPLAALLVEMAEQLRSASRMCPSPSASSMSKERSSLSPRTVPELMGGASLGFPDLVGRPERTHGV